MRIDEWFLTAAERGNPATGLDAAPRTASHGRPATRSARSSTAAAYFAELLARVRAMRAGDLLLFTDWRGDPDERLAARRARR